MNILFLSGSFPQPQDPSRCPYNLHRCEALARSHEVRVVSPVSWRDRRGPRITSGAIGRLKIAYPTYYYPAGFFRGSHAWWLYQSIRRSVSDIVQAFRPDVVLSYWTYPDSAVGIRIARRAGVPAVAFVGGSDVLLGAQNAASAGRILRVLQEADAVATVSDHLQEQICRLGVPAAKVHTVPAAVDTTLFSAADRAGARARLGIGSGERILLWVGRMVEVKGVRYLLEACRRLASGGDAFRLILVGDGPLRHALAEQVRALDLTANVTFAGRILQPDLPDWYRAADVAVLPSLSEGTPNVLLEARACGTPFVASAVGGIPPLAVPGVDELVPPMNADALATALAGALARTIDRDALVSCAGGWDEAAARLTAVFEMIVRRRLSAAGASAPIFASQPR